MEARRRARGRRVGERQQGVDAMTGAHSNNDAIRTTAHFLSTNKTLTAFNSKIILFVNRAQDRASVWTAPPGRATDSRQLYRRYDYTRTVHAAPTYCRAARAVQRALPRRCKPRACNARAAWPVPLRRHGARRAGAYLARCARISAPRVRAPFWRPASPFPPAPPPPRNAPAPRPLRNYGTVLVRW